MHNIYIYILYIYITPGCILYIECTQANLTRLDAPGLSQPRARCGTGGTGLPTIRQNHLLPSPRSPNPLQFARSRCAAAIRPHCPLRFLLLARISRGALAGFRVAKLPPFPSRAPSPAVCQFPLACPHTHCPRQLPEAVAPP